MRLPILLVLAAALTRNLLAVTVAPDVAASAARGFVVRGRTLGARLGMLVERTRLYETTNGIPFYAVKMYGGGTVFLSSDTDETPVIAYTSATNDFSALDPNSPLAVLLSRDSAARASVPSVLLRSSSVALWTELLEIGDRSATPRLAFAGQATVGDVRVAALLESQWDQQDAGGGYCYNYYTPNHWYCGCVATAMSQVMRYHRFPVQTCPKRTHDLCRVGNVQTNFTTQGGIYEWTNMPLKPDASLTETNRQAIGKLTSDAGIAVEMQYTSSGSGTYSAFVPEAFRSDFGYAQAHYASVCDGYGSSFSQQGIGKAILSNLDAGLPIMLGISHWSNQSGYVNGHSIVADGYGYQDRALYLHLNMGWSGEDDLWYNPPNIGTLCGFNVVDEIIYDIMPTKGDGRVLSGRITDGAGTPVAKAEVTLFGNGSDIALMSVTTSVAGVYAFVTTSGTYRITAVASDSAAFGSVEPVVLPDLKEDIDPDWQKYGKQFLCVESEAELGNSWGNDIVVAESTITLTVGCEVSAEASVSLSPAKGKMTYPLGTTLTLSAPALAECTNEFATAYARCPCLGFIGTGSLPASGTTNAVTVTLTNDTTIIWRYSKTPSHFRLRTWETFPDWWLYSVDDFYSSFWIDDEWLEAGSVRSYALPVEAVGGDSFDWTTWFYAPGQRYYNRGTLTMKLCGVKLSDPGGQDETWQFDAAHRYAMPTNVTLRINRAYDIDFVYLPTIDFWTHKLPSWWVLRHLYGPLENGLIDEISEKGDPDGDGCSNRHEYRTGTDPMDPASLRHPFMVLLF